MGEKRCRWWLSRCRHCGLLLRSCLAAPWRATAIGCPDCEIASPVMSVSDVPLAGYRDTIATAARPRKRKE